MPQVGDMKRAKKSDADAEMPDAPAAKKLKTEKKSKSSWTSWPTGIKKWRLKGKRQAWL